MSADPKWEFHIKRLGQQQRTNRQRTIGEYVVLHDRVPVPSLSGMCSETRGPGDNSHTGNNRCVEAGRYPLSTQDGEKYVTIGYTTSRSTSALPRPGLLLGSTGNRVAILIHPGRGFLSSIGCINPCQSVHGALDDIDFDDSRRRVIALIDDLKSHLGHSFPSQNGHPIPGAFVSIE